MRSTCTYKYISICQPTHAANLILKTLNTTPYYQIVMATFEVSASFQQLQHLNIPQLPTTPQHTYHQIESLANLKTESKTQFYRHKARLHDPQTVKEHSLIKLKNPQKRIMLIGGDISARIMACSCCYCMPCSQQLGEQYVLFYISYKYKICWFI